jgi:hypothetical protein
MEKINPTETWGGRLAADLAARQSPTTESAYLLFEEWFRRELAGRLFHFAPPPPIALSHTFGACSIGMTGPVVDSWEIKTLMGLNRC